MSTLFAVLVYWSVIAGFTVIGIGSISLDKLSSGEQSETISVEFNNNRDDIASNTISNLENDSVKKLFPTITQDIKVDSTDLISDFGTKHDKNITFADKKTTKPEVNTKLELNSTEIESSSGESFIKPLFSSLLEVTTATSNTDLSKIEEISETFKNVTSTDSSIKINVPNRQGSNATKEDDSSDTTIFYSKQRRYDGAQVWKILVQSEKDRKNAEELLKKYDGQIWKEVKAEVDCLLRSNVLNEAEQYIRSSNLSHIILIDDLQKIIDVENPSKEEIENLQNRNGLHMTWKAYHRLADIHDFFDFLAKTYPQLCSVKIIGYSYKERPLKILKIANGKKGNSAIWIDGGIHAREWISPATVTYIAYQIAEGWDDLPPFMREIDWYIHGVANPDGYEYSHTVDRLWRKNFRPYGRTCRGVDLNRNFGFKWGGKGTSANACSEVYRGSKAFSEPETFAISSFLTQFGKGYFKAFISFHSYGQYILYPWGFDNVNLPDNSDLERVAREAATKMARSGSGKYTIGPSAATLYPAAGGSDDWARGVADIKYAYTVELGDTGRYGFILPAKYIERNGQDGYIFIETVARTVMKNLNISET